MKRLDRRTFLKQTAGATAALSLPFSYTSQLFQDTRKFRLSLYPQAIGVILSQLEMVEKAAEYGFEAIVPLPAEVAAMSDDQIKYLQDRMAVNNLTWDAASLPTNFRSNELEFRQELFRLSAFCAALESVGVTRMCTWIMPSHEELTYRSNFDRHVRRIGLMADVLANHNIKLGLEYVGPKTAMTSQRFSFIRTMTEVQELIGEINRPNLGLQLDSFHWYCAGETDVDILGLDKDMIITVDLNDARSGRTADEQVDNERELPGVTGQINLKSFMTALRDIGYDGPIRAEPFNEMLNAMDNDLALEATFRSMKTTFDLL